MPLCQISVDLVQSLDLFLRDGGNRSTLFGCGDERSEAFQAVKMLISHFVLRWEFPLKPQKTIAHQTTIRESPKQSYLPRPKQSMGQSIHPQVTTPIACDG